MAAGIVQDGEKEGVGGGSDKKLVGGFKGEVAVEEKIMTGEGAGWDAVKDGQRLLRQGVHEFFGMAYAGVGCRMAAAGE